MSRAIPSISDGLIEYLQGQNLLDDLPELIGLLQAEVDRKHEVTVVSAATLDAGERKEIARQTALAWGEHPISYHVDPLLVSGLLVRFRDQLLDLSTRGRLTDLKEYLA